MKEPEFTSFNPTLFTFFKELAANNNRDWFQANKQRYEDEVVAPVFSFIRAMRPRLHRVSPCLQAIDRKVGGSMFRIYRDVRFSKDKTPYKTHVAIRFNHTSAKQCSAPGCYVSLAPGEVIVGVGVWRPPSPDLNRIRARIDSRQRAWLRARNDKEFAELFEWGGESLKRPPQGYSADHPLIEDLKRKDLAAFRKMTVKDALRKDFPDTVGDAFLAARPLLAFLAEAAAVDF